MIKAGDKVTADNAFDGAKVRRGPDWKWGDQDGGDKVGELSDIPRGYLWVTVSWGDGLRGNRYRIGEDGKFDLVFAESYPTSRDVHIDLETEMRPPIYHFPKRPTMYTFNYKPSGAKKLITFYPPEKDGYRAVVVAIPQSYGYDIGAALCAPGDQFNRKTGREIAKARFFDTPFPFYCVGRLDENGETLMNAIMRKARMAAL